MRTASAVSIRANSTRRSARCSMRKAGGLSIAVVDPAENCFPMINRAALHNEMLLGDAATRIEDAITEEGKVMV